MPVTASDRPARGRVLFMLLKKWMETGCFAVDTKKPVKEVL
ncbi:hypothetical protein N473_04730 [Pseudoalteromonas luteoviolacea CPMOR-1]|uniref:Uncharacterized protein n=1 Tax=Pseudoalteromonas luteoviolacea CPMOR-1 TaxID=1365248 RepID=A0A167I0A7_9GAMM|nr:hypothetical protein N473_04730 [Pseudoalteromonas luteoviolacea CPMOR-1]